MISVEQLTRIYTRKKKNGFFSPVERVDIPAVLDLSFQISAGERVAFIGPNGAGKTTTLRMLTGLLYPTSGMARVNGLIPWQDRQQLARSIGLVFGQRSQLWADLPVRDSFESLAVIYDLKRPDFIERMKKLVDTLMIGDFVDQPVRSLSLGQRMRCEIAASLLHRPKVLFLDEPTIGLDVEAKAILRDYLRDLNKIEETTVILTSHDTGDIEDICNRVIMIDHGKKLIDQPIHQLQSEFDCGRRIIVTCHEKDPYIDFPVEMIEEAHGHRIVLNIDTRTRKLADVIAAIQSQVDVTDMTIERTSLETIIRALYARKAVMP